MLASFDIFDTTLIRKCGEADNVFWMMAKRLFPNDIDTQSKFVFWRKSANQKMVCLNINYTLKDLYDVNDVKGLFDVAAEELLLLEYSVESEMLVANPVILSKIRQHRKAGAKIAFISDMYLYSSFLKDILIREGAFEDGDTIYVSCEHNARKEDGSLYDLVRADLQPAKWEHYGDNYHSDVSIAKKKGIKAHFVNSGYSRIEKQFSLSSEGLCIGADYSILMGYLRYFRLTGNDTPESAFAIDFIAPLYCGYVKHVIEDAKRRGLKTLYFLSRDSYIFLKIAEQIPHDGLELKYLYVSRKSIQPAFRHIATDDEFKESINGNSVIPARQDSDSVCYENLDAYFEQEGVYGDDIALVDLGWFGSTRMMVNKLRENKGIGQCFCYYLGVIENVLSEVYGQYDAFTYSQCFANNRWHTFLLEEYFSLCPHPSTIGYKKEGNKVVPVFDCKTIEHSHHVNDNIDCCCRFAKENIPVGLSTLKYFGLNSFCSMDNELEKEYSKLLFNACRREEFLYRDLKVKDLYSYSRGWTITLNDKLALEASFGIVTRAVVNALRRSYTEVRELRNKLFNVNL